ncbi:hypothetical protein [Gimesia maris]|uniref:hypothetical protein n=1 Tax=Gimesia maris TaxID=122 RepID=UPI00241CFA5D|nr:hypothetical protein [Gimesia maris]|tara:strand:- start:238164 stop:238805 length:642 start_codon:yes stop_codon:yes gene_type:complete
MKNIADVIKHAESDQLFWDFYEEAENAQEDAKNTVPGRIIDFLLNDRNDRNEAARTIGLLTTFAARRSLVCWFFYCENESPLFVANSLERYWVDCWPEITHIDESWLAKTKPSENGNLIIDCRWQDTYSASSAVAHAARFAKNQVPHDAIISLSHACIAFQISPTGSSVKFIDWLVNIAVPCAFEGNYMPSEKMFAMADFDFPLIMKNVRSDR